MIEELYADNGTLRSDYIHLGRELGQIINENRRIKRENWNLKKTKGRRK